MKKISVKSKSFTYPVFIGSQILHTLPEFLEKHKLYKNVFIVIDENVEKIYGTEMGRLVKRWAKRSTKFVLKATERTKSVSTLKNIYTALADNEFGRDTLLISIGGGITGDIIKPGHLCAVDIVLVEFRTPVQVMQIIQTGPNRHTTVKYRKARFDQLCKGDTG